MLKTIILDLCVTFIVGSMFFTNMPLCNFMLLWFTRPFLITLAVGIGVLLISCIFLLLCIGADKYDNTHEN